MWEKALVVGVQPSRGSTISSKPPVQFGAFLVPPRGPLLPFCFHSLASLALLCVCLLTLFCAWFALS